MKGYTCSKKPLIQNLLCLQITEQFSFLQLLSGLLIGRRKKVKLSRIFREKFVERAANLVGNSQTFSGVNFTQKMISKKWQISWEFSRHILQESDHLCIDLTNVFDYKRCQFCQFFFRNWWLLAHAIPAASETLPTECCLIKTGEFEEKSEQLIWTIVPVCICLARGSFY